MKKFISKKKFFFIFLIYLINNILGANIPYSLAQRNSDTSEEIKLSTDYLNKIFINDYILGPGDTLRLIVSRYIPELNTEALIDGEGTIYLPKLKRVYVENLTINELNQILNEAYKKYVKFPSVEVSIVKYRPIKVLVEGEVTSPGLKTLNGAFSVVSKEEFALRNLQDFNQINQTFYFPSVFDAIRASGGITEYSNLKNIEIIRKNNISNGGGKKKTTINFLKLLDTGDNSQNIRIYDSDIIRIKKTLNRDENNLSKAILSNLNPKFINVFVAGRVKSPGTIKVSPANVLSDAVSMAGGPSAIRGKAVFLRINNDGTISKRKFKYRENAKRGSFKNPNLKNGDLIIIGDSFFSITNEILTDLTQPLFGIYGSYSIIEAISD